MKLNLANCEICHKVIILKGNNNNICEECFEKDMENFQSVRKYIRENINTSIQDILLNTNISLDTVLRWQREKRLF